MNTSVAVERVWSALANLVTRGKLVLSAYSAGGARTMLQGVGLEGETHQGIELLLPYGRSALPTGQTADYLVFQVNGTRDHKVAIGADDPALRIPDLASGEFGDRNYRGSQVVLRVNKIEVTAPLDDIDITAAQSNINIVTNVGTITLSAAGGITLSGSGNLAVSGFDHITMSATGGIALTAPTHQITANGNVLG